VSWLYSQALVAEYSLASCSGTPLCAPSSETEPPQAFSCDARTTDTFNHSRSGMTCGPLTAEHGAGLLTWFLAASRAKTSALPEAAMAWTASAPAYGEKWPAWFAKWNPASCEWRTAQCSLLEDSEQFSETWPRSGLMRAGTCYLLPTVAPFISANASGSLLPTLTVCGNYNAKGASKKAGDGLATALAKRLPTLLASDAAKGGPNAMHGSGTMSLTSAVARLPTLAARDYRSPNAKSYAERGGGKKGEQLPNAVGGPLNPEWCEWFMGFPIGWTASRPLETHKYQEWRQQHGPCS
jgi:hypothetical protein